MIVCHCTGTRDRDIRRAAESRAADKRATPVEIGRACGAGGECGGCLETICAILREGRGSAQISSSGEHAA